jgi:hypothetical protein
MTFGTSPDNQQVQALTAGKIWVQVSQPLVVKAAVFLLLFRN